MSRVQVAYRAAASTYYVDGPFLLQPFQFDRDDLLPLVRALCRVAAAGGRVGKLAPGHKAAVYGWLVPEEVGEVEDE